MLRGPEFAPAHIVSPDNPLAALENIGGHILNFRIGAYSVLQYGVAIGAGILLYKGIKNWVNG